MLNSKKKLLSVVLSTILVITLVFSVGSVTAFAAFDDVDVQGNRINEIIDDFIADWYDEEWVYDRQCPENQGTLVFIDSQLLEFDFLERLCNLFDDRSYNRQGLIDIYAGTGMRFLVHNGGNTYVDVTWYAVYGGERAYVYNFDDPEVLMSLFDQVGNMSMCALGIWALPSTMYDFLYSLQYAWNDDFVTYVIERDPIIFGTDGLNLKIYDSAGGGFFTLSGGGGIA